MSFVEPAADRLTPNAARPIQQAPAETPWPKASTAWFALILVSLSSVFAAVDRGIIALLVDPIRRDLGLTDSQMALLLGLAFVVFYLLFALPLARLIDNGQRRRVLAAGIGVWSLATILSGFAHSFWQLFVCRVGIGAGESVQVPASQSLMADYFPPARLPLAMAVLTFGFIAGSGLALVVGAAVIKLLAGTPHFHLPLVGVMRDWQLTFVIVGLPGLLVAAAMLLVPEPVRRGRSVAQAGQRLPYTAVLTYLLANRRLYGPFYLSTLFSSIAMNGVAVWTPTVFARSYGWDTSRFGFLAGPGYTAAAVVGLFTGAWLAGRMARSGRDDANLRLSFLSLAVSAPVCILFPLLPDPWVAFTLAMLQTFIFLLGTPAQQAALQIVTPNEMRGQVTVINLLIFTTIGTGLGPTFVAAITDFVLRSPEQLRYSLALTAALCFPTAAFFMRLCIRPYGEAIRRLREA